MHLFLVFPIPLSFNLQNPGFIPTYPLSFIGMLGHKTHLYSCTWTPRQIYRL